MMKNCLLQWFPKMWPQDNHDIAFVRTTKSFLEFFTEVLKPR